MQELKLRSAIREFDSLLKLSVASRRYRSGFCTIQPSVWLTTFRVAASGGNTIHEMHEAELVLFVEFRMISWIVLVQAGRTRNQS